MGVASTVSVSPELEAIDKLLVSHEPLEEDVILTLFKPLMALYVGWNSTGKVPNCLLGTC